MTCGSALGGDPVAASLSGAFIVLLRVFGGGRILKASDSARARLLQRSRERRAAATIESIDPAAVVPEPKEVFIQGRTKAGKAFRPSDWAERLAGAMSCFRPEGSIRGA